MKTKISIVWCIEDIHLRAGEGILTDEQACEVLVLLERTHDCNYGISWDTIDVGIETILSK